MTAEPGPNNPSQAGEQISAESYLKVRALTANKTESIEEILHRAAERMRGLEEKATIQLRLIRADETAHKIAYTIQLTPAGASLQMESSTKPTLVLVTTSAIFREIAAGAYSPVQGFVEGKLYLQGDVNLGKRLVQHLSESNAVVNVCPFLDAESWRSDRNGRTGSLTLTGLNFSPNGRVDIHYDWGGGQNLKIVFADARGRFTASESLFCGDIPGMPGVGVTVVAFDIRSGMQTVPNKYSTPC